MFDGAGCAVLFMGTESMACIAAGFTVERMISNTDGHAGNGRNGSGGVTHPFPGNFVNNEHGNARNDESNGWNARSVLPLVAGARRYSLGGGI